MSLITFKAKSKTDSDGNLVFKTDCIAQGLAWLALGILLMYCFYGMMDMTFEDGRKDADVDFLRLMFGGCFCLPSVVLTLVGGRYLFTWTVLKIDTRTAHVEWRKNGFWVAENRRFDLKELKMAIYPYYGSRAPELRFTHKGTSLMRIMADSDTDKLSGYAAELASRFESIAR